MPASTGSKGKRRTVRHDPQSSSTATQIPVADPSPTDKYAADSWISGGIGGMHDLKVPSGQLCLVRRPGVEGLIAAGVLEQVDSLTGLVNEKHIKKSSKGRPSQLNVGSILKDQTAVDNMIDVINKVIRHCVVKPEIHRAPNDRTLRKPGIVYDDMVDFVDKGFIFNYVVGGTSDLESFRGGLGEALDGVEPLQAVPDATE